MRCIISATERQWRGYQTPWSVCVCPKSSVSSLILHDFMWRSVRIVPDAQRKTVFKMKNCLMKGADVKQKRVWMHISVQAHHCYP